VTLHLQLSIGPVQTFVAQSRRTRDLWSGSYLLSLLAANAIKGAEGAGASIVRPMLEDDPMLRWVRSGSAGEPPRIGSVPNRLTFRLPEGADRAGSVATAAQEALADAWRRLCDAVWKRYVEPVAALGNETRAIWERQVGTFWEVLWVAGQEGEHDLLDRRKAWRTHWLPEEGGTKCNVIPQLQEISGYVRATHRVPQDAFWNEVRSRVHGRAARRDLEEQERLCAVALVKRLFASVSEEVFGRYVDVKHWASTVDVAAAPWREEVLRTARPAAETFANAVVKASPEVGRLIGPEPDGAERFRRLDANWFHRSFVQVSKEALVASEVDRGPVLQKLEAIRKDHERGSPPIYFAVLLADGDRLGTLVQQRGSEVVSEALAKFTAAVPKLVKGHQGVSVYAGGDDVLALLPLESALPCARDLEREYRASFGARAPEATLSAAVVFAHARDPLNWILEEVHRLLDDVAKDENGRSSLVAAVHRAVTSIRWVTTWKRAAPGHEDAVECLIGLVKALRSESGGLSSKLVQDLRQTFSLLCGGDPMAPGTFVALGADADALPQILRGEIEHRIQHHEGAPPSGDEVERLVTLVGGVLDRAPSGGPTGQIGVDGLMLAAFLANGGREDEHGP